jgi:hypothetical protein
VWTGLQKRLAEGRTRATEPIRRLRFRRLHFVHLLQRASSTEWDTCDNGGNMRTFYLIKLPLMDGITQVEIMKAKGPVAARHHAERLSKRWNAVVVVAEYDSLYTAPNRAQSSN